MRCCQYTTSCFKEEMGVSLRLTFGLRRSPYHNIATATVGRCQSLITTERSEDEDNK